MNQKNTPAVAALFLSLVPSLALPACSSAPPAPSGDAAGDGGATPPPDAGTDAPGIGPVDAGSEVASPADAAVDAPQTVTVTVTGHVVDTNDATKPLVGRPIVVIDAAGHLLSTTAGAAGSFSVSGVVPPYDAMVAAPSWAGGYAYAFLDVSTLQPRLLGLSDAPPPVKSGSWHNAQATLPIVDPACGSATCEMSSLLVDDSNLGVRVSGAQTGNYLTAGIRDWPQTFSWFSTSTTENVGVRALFFDDANTHYWFGQYDGLTVMEGGLGISGTIDPTPIPTAGNVTVVLNGNGLPASWASPSMNVYLDYPQMMGGGEALLVKGTADSLFLGVPDILGATFSVNASDGDQSPPPNLWRGSQARQSKLPLSTTNVSLNVYGPPTVASPMPGGTLSASGQVAWSGTPAQQVTIVTFADQLEGAEDLVLYTSGSTIDLKRLSLAGFTLATGMKYVTLMARGRVTSLDDMLDETKLATPDGSSTEYVTEAFTVTP